jgi:peptide/nickel transport system permease protein
MFSNYYVKRLLLLPPTLLGVAVLVFFLLRVIPGDVVELRLRGDGGAASDAMIAAERIRLGLDQPLVWQFVEWMRGLLTLDLGRSMWTDRPVIEEIATRIGPTVEIALLATVLAIAIAVPLGAVSAASHRSPIDYLFRILTVSGLAIPSFWFGMLVIMVLLNVFGWLPPLNYASFFEDPLTNLSQMIWPAFAVGARYAALLARMIRSSLLDVLGEDYVRTARAKGMMPNEVLLKHAIPNALLPTVTVVGLEFAFLIGGLAVTEQVFNINGVGRLLVQAVGNNDFILIQGIVMVMAAAFVVTNLLVDLLYSVLDPRVRYS